MKPAVVIMATFTAVWLVLSFIGCGTARRGEPIAGPLRLDDVQLVNGRQIFSTHCHQCHPGGEGGLGPAINNKPLPDFLIRLQVRKGLGVMPAFSEEEISEEDMNHLLRYLQALQENSPGGGGESPRASSAHTPGNARAAAPLPEKKFQLSSSVARAFSQ